MSASRSLGVALDQLGIGVGVLATLVIVLVVAAPHEPTWVLLLFPAVGMIYGAAGLVAWRRRPSNRMGALLIFGAYAWLLASLANVEPPVLVAMGTIVATVPIAVVVHLLHAFPSGRLPTRASRVVVAAVYFLTLVMEAPRYLFVATPSPYDLLTVSDRPDLARWGGAVQSGLGAVLVSPPPSSWSGGCGGPTGRSGGCSGPCSRTASSRCSSCRSAQTCWLPCWGSIRSPGRSCSWRCSPACPSPSRSVCCAGDSGAPGRSRSWAPGWEPKPGCGPRSPKHSPQPSAIRALKLVFWVPERECYVDSAGRVVDPPPPGSSRAMVQIDLAGRRVGAIIYDATLIADPEPVRQASRVVAIAVDHERLTAEVLASREALRQSRARIVEAGDAERRRIAQDLHDGLQARLVMLALKAYAIGDDPTASDPVREEAAELRAGIDTAAAELRQLVHGVMPALLIERGLYAATEDLVDRMPIPTRLELSGNDHGLSPVVQSTAYFTLSEGLTNAVKHARASRLEVSLGRADGLLNIEIGDDGVGGAAAGWGVGLRGLTDRLDVLGGTLQVQSSPTQGTRLVVEVPCGS